MGPAPDYIDPATAELITQNIDLSFRFMREVIADPTLLDDIPASGSIVVVVPADDPELAAMNLATAERLAAEGKSVIVKHVGVEPITAEGWERLNAKIPAWAPAWAPDLDHEGAMVVYDQQRDALLVDLARGQRQGWGWPLNELVYLLLDDETEEAFAYLVPNLLSRVVLRMPGLAQILSVAELRPLTEVERGQLQIMEPAPSNGSGHGQPTAASEQARDRFLADIRQLSEELVTA